MGTKGVLITREQIEDYVKNFNVADEWEKLILEVVEKSCEAGRAQGIDIGRLEVVEFVTDEVFPLLDMASVSVQFKDKWNTKLARWGIIKEENHDTT